MYKGVAISLDGYETYIKDFPAQIKKSRTAQTYFEIAQEKEGLQLQGLFSYKIKIADPEMIERKYLESGFRIFVIKSIQEPQHNFDGFIDLQQDNVVNTFLYIQLKKDK